jgi:hypothetical protein
MDPARDVSPTAPEAPTPATNEVITQVKDNVTDIKEKAMDSIQNIVNTVTNSRASMIVASLFVGAAVAFTIAYILYWIISKSSNLSRIEFIVPGTKAPLTGYESHQVSSSGIPSFSKTGTISFWIYVNDFGTVMNNKKIYRHVWHRGAEKWSATTTGPLVLLESKNTNGVQTNKLHVSFRSSDLESPSDNQNLTTNDQRVEYMVASRGITIDYIPIKRWVHIAVAVNTTSKNMRAFVDGELVKKIDGNATKQLESNTSIRARRMLDKIDLNGSGDLYIGGRPSSTLGNGFAGLVSNIKYINTDLSTYEVYQQYKLGPIDNLLSRMGLPAYGLRTPIYKMGSE